MSATTDVTIDGRGGNTPKSAAVVKKRKLPSIRWIKIKLEQLQPPEHTLNVTWNKPAGDQENHYPLSGLLTKDGLQLYMLLHPVIVAEHEKDEYRVVAGWNGLAAANVLMDPNHKIRVCLLKSSEAEFEAIAMVDALATPLVTGNDGHPGVVAYKWDQIKKTNSIVFNKVFSRFSTQDDFARIFDVSRKRVSAWLKPSPSENDSGNGKKES